MKGSSLARIADFGQSIWMDYIERRMIRSGELQRLIDDDGLRGITSNPTIFEKAISGSNDYDEQIETLAAQGESAEEIYTRIVTDDVRAATDLFRPLFDRSNGRHGFVSLEVSPHLARETEETIVEAHRLWSLVDRPNVFIKVPGTAEGLPAIRQLLREGINVNITLLFGLERYEAVTEAYLGGLEDRLRDGATIDSLASVASFFLSRIDVLVDPLLDVIIHGDKYRAALAQPLRGQVAIASAKLAYQIYLDVFGSDRYRGLAEHGAQTQRVLWASTSTKDPEYSDVKYVEPLIGPGTVNTMPPETLDAYRDHGEPMDRLLEDLTLAKGVFSKLAELGIDISEVTGQLEDEGIDKFIQPYDKLLDTLRKKCGEVDRWDVEESPVLARKGAQS